MKTLLKMVVVTLVCLVCSTYSYGMMRYRVYPTNPSQRLLPDELIFLVKAQQDELKRLRESIAHKDSIISLQQALIQAHKINSNQNDKRFGTLDNTIAVLKTKLSSLQNKTH